MKNQFKLILVCTLIHEVAIWPPKNPRISLVGAAKEVSDIQKLYR